MSTKVHLRKHLLEAIDQRARALKMSRNQWIVRTLEKEISGGPGWSAGFFERLAQVDGATVVATDEMVAAIRSSKCSKEPRRL